LPAFNIFLTTFGYFVYLAFSKETKEKIIKLFSPFLNSQAVLDVFFFVA